MVMDYHKLNRQTIKNNYPLLLIMELVDNMGSKRVFTKMDLRWGYNNVRIKEGNEWKVAFITHVGSFKPVVMFFGMTNSPAVTPELKIPSNGGIRGHTAQYRLSGAHSRVYR